MRHEEPHVRVPGVEAEELREFQALIEFNYLISIYF